MSIGRVLNAAFGAIFGNLFVMLGIAFLFAGLPQGIIAYVQQLLTELTEVGAISTFQYVGYFVGTVVLNMLFTVLAQGALVRATVAFSRGERASFGDCVATAFQQLLPLLGLGIVSGLAIAIASLLFLVPGLILMTMWYVAAPVIVAERRGVFDALRRSSALTLGQRWNVFILLLVVFAVGLVVFMLSAMIGGVAGTMGAMVAGGGGLGRVILVAGAGIIGATINMTITGALPTAAYVELRGLKEGGDAATLDHIFA